MTPAQRTLYAFINTCRAHYIAFDLFVGRWIWETAREEGRSCRVALLLTWMAGPAGLTVFLGQRALRR